MEDKIIEGTELAGGKSGKMSFQSGNPAFAANEGDLKQLQRQHSSVLQSGRQIFSIAINCLQQLHNIKDGNSMTDNLGETIDNYKMQLVKYQ